MTEGKLQVRNQTDPWDEDKRIMLLDGDAVRYLNVDEARELMQELFVAIRQEVGVGG